MIRGVGKKSSNNFCRYGKHSYLCSPNKKGVKFTDVSEIRKKIETMVNREKFLDLILFNHCYIHRPAERRCREVH